MFEIKAYYIESRNALLMLFSLLNSIDLHCTSVFIACGNNEKDVGSADRVITLKYALWWKHFFFPNEKILNTLAKPCCGFWMGRNALEVQQRGFPDSHDARNCFSV